MEKLKLELKQEIITALNIEDMQPEDIEDDAPLFGDNGLGLDSIDALELIVMLEKKYGIKLKDPTQSKKVFRSVTILAEFVTENRTK